MNTSAILDDRILNDKTTVLQPTPNFIAKSIQKINDFGKWLSDYIPPKPKVVDEALEKIVQQEREFLLIERVKICVEKVFAIQYRIDGKDWIYPDLFLVNAKQSITNILIIRRQTKVKLILLSMMEKVDLKSSAVIAKEAEFHYKAEFNLESTNANELFSKIKETVIKSLAKF